MEFDSHDDVVALRKSRIYEELRKGQLPEDRARSLAELFGGIETLLIDLQKRLRRIEAMDGQYAPAQRGEALDIQLERFEKLKRGRG